MSYKNILNRQIAEFNGLYKTACKKFPSMSIVEKQKLSLAAMMKHREIEREDILKMLDIKNNCLKFQYSCEVVLTETEIEEGIMRYYIKDDNLFDFFKTTEIKAKDVQSIFSSNVFANGTAFGVIGQTFSCVIYVIQDLSNRHFVSVFTDDMNYTFWAEEFDKKVNGDYWVFNLAMNFLFYLQAFPECIIDGVPNGVKRNPKAKSISISDKVVSHRENGEHGFVRAHFRSGYFRHLNSDYFVNCKGQVRFISSTMVKGKDKAKTIINKYKK